MSQITPRSPDKAIPFAPIELHGVKIDNFLYFDQFALNNYYQIVGEPNSKKCVIKGDNLSVKGPTKNLYILIAEVVLMTVWGGVFPMSGLPQHSK